MPTSRWGVLVSPAGHWGVEEVSVGDCCRQLSRMDDCPVNVSEPESWTIRHFSQANPKGAGEGDVPALLRRVADTLEGLGPVEVMDLVLHNEVTDDGETWYSITVYF